MKCNYSWMKNEEFYMEGSVIEDELLIEEPEIAKVFGLKFSYSNENGTETLIVGDISSVKTKVDSLLEDIYKYEVSWVHIMDVIEDFLID